MSNLLKLMLTFRVLLPEGATGGSGTLEYLGIYRVAALLAGASTGVKIVLDQTNKRLGLIRNITDGGDVLLLGAQVGDPVPPYVKITLYPTLPYGKGDPIILEGRPHEYPEGSGYWDFEDIGVDPLGPTVASREEKLNLLAATDDARAAAASVTAATLDLSTEKQEVAQTLQRVEQLADAIDASGLVYLGTDADGAVLLATVEPLATVSNETTDWGLIGAMTGPVITIGGQ